MRAGNCAAKDVCAAAGADNATATAAKPIVNRMSLPGSPHASYRTAAELPLNPRFIGASAPQRGVNEEWKEPLNAPAILIATEGARSEDWQVGLASF